MCCRAGALCFGTTTVAFYGINSNLLNLILSKKRTHFRPDLFSTNLRRKWQSYDLLGKL
jgi:hypothetical protein